MPNKQKSPTQKMTRKQKGPTQQRMFHAKELSNANISRTQTQNRILLEQIQKPDTKRIPYKQNRHPQTTKTTTHKKNVTHKKE